MKRKHYHLTDQQIKALKREAKRTGLNVSEIVRRAIDAYFETRPLKANLMQVSNFEGNQQ